MRIARKSDIKRLVNEFFNNVADDYGFRKYPCGFFHTIIDVGANSGMFSLLARFMHPTANVSAYEPDLQAFDCLQANALYLRIECHNKAVGLGEPLFCIPSVATIGLRYEAASDLTSDVSCDSMRLVDMIPATKGKTFVKMDCEGGENIIFDDPESMAALLTCSHVSIETHGTHGMGLAEATDRWVAALEPTHDAVVMSTSRKGRIVEAVKR